MQEGGHMILRFQFDCDASRVVGVANLLSFDAVALRVVTEFKQ